MAWTNENGIERSLSWKALFLSYVAYLNSRGCSILLIVTLSHQCTVKLWVLMGESSISWKSIWYVGVQAYCIMSRLERRSDLNDFRSAWTGTHTPQWLQTCSYLDILTHNFQLV